MKKAISGFQKKMKDKTRGKYKIRITKDSRNKLHATS